MRPPIADASSGNSTENAMQKLKKYLIVCFGIVPLLVAAQTTPNAAKAAKPRLTVEVETQSTQTIYKHIDERGRVSYANSPIAGGIKLDLQPPTVIANAIGVGNSTTTPTINLSGPSSATAPSVPNIAVTPPITPPITPLTTPPSATPAATPPAIVVAKVTSVPSPTRAAAAVLATPPTPPAPPPPPASVATKPTPAVIASATPSGQALQRRTDMRKRIVTLEIEAEQKSLDAARRALTAEQQRSTEIRTMRASFSMAAATATPQKPLITPKARTEIERHFERVRDLQDKIALHEANITALREELTTEKS